MDAIMDKITLTTYTNTLLKDHHHTGNCYLSYFEKYASTFFGPNPDVELFNLKPHIRSWILQSIKRFGDYYFRKYNNREVTQLIKQISQ
jgi:hypothetical protein